MIQQILLICLFKQHAEGIGRFQQPTCTASDSVVLTEPKTYFPANPKNIHVWISTTELERAWKDLKLTTTILKNQWKPGGYPVIPGASYEFEQLAWVGEHEVDPPKVYRTKQDATSLREIQQACGYMGLEDLDIGAPSFNDHSRAALLKTVCGKEFEKDAGYKKECLAKSLETGTTYNSPEDCLTKLDAQKHTNLQANQKCGLWLNLRRQGMTLVGRAGHPIVEIPYQTKVGTSDEAVLEETELHLLLRDNDNFPHAYQYGFYPDNASAVVQCTGYHALPETVENSEQNPDPDLCPEEKVGKRVYCTDPMEYGDIEAKQAMQLKLWVSQCETELEEIAGTLEGFLRTSLKFTSEIKPAATKDVLRLGPPWGWGRVMTHLKALIWTSLGTVGAPTQRQLTTILDQLAILKTRISRTTLNYQVANIEELRTLVTTDTQEDPAKVVYLNPQVQVIPVIKNEAGDIKARVTIDLAFDYDEEERVRVLPINHQGTRIVDKYLLLNRHTGQLMTYTANPINESYCDVVKWHNHQEDVCIVPGDRWERGNAKCATQLIDPHGRLGPCTVEKSPTPTFFRHFCYGKENIMVSPADGAVTERCHDSSGKWEEYRTMIKKGWQILNTTCQIWFRGEEIYPGGPTPQDRMRKLTQLENAIEKWWAENKSLVIPGLMAGMVLFILGGIIALMKILNCLRGCVPTWLFNPELNPPLPTPGPQLPSMESIALVKRQRITYPCDVLPGGACQIEEAIRPSCPIEEPLLRDQVRPSCPIEEPLLRDQARPSCPIEEPLLRDQAESVAASNGDRKSGRSSKSSITTSSSQSGRSTSKYAALPGAGPKTLEALFKDGARKQEALQRPWQPDGGANPGNKRRNTNK